MTESAQWADSMKTRSFVVICCDSSFRVFLRKFVLQEKAAYGSLKAFSRSALEPSWPVVIIVRICLNNIFICHSWFELCPPWLDKILLIIVGRQCLPTIYKERLIWSVHSAETCGWTKILHIFNSNKCYGLHIQTKNIQKIGAHW